MSKQFPYPFPERFRSRLMLHYRTRISGTEVQKKLPFRVLVLGNLRGAAAHGEDLEGKPTRDGVLTARPLPDREIRSFRFGKAGARVDDFMAELMPYVVLSKELTTTLKGQLKGLTLTGKKPAATKQGETAKVKLSGSAEFLSTEANNGLCDVRAHVRITAEAEIDTNDLTKEQSLKLTCRGLARGHLTVPAREEPIGVVVGVVQPVTVKATFKGSEKTDGEIEAVITGDIDATAQRVLPFDSVDGFNPDEVVANVPELQRLRVIRELLSVLRSEIRNVPELRDELKKVLTTKPDDLKALAKELKQPYAQLAITLEKTP